MRWFPVAAALTSTAAVLALSAGCSATDDAAGPAPTGSASAGGPKVVASTSWVAALAKAAGATDITVIAPATVDNPQGYDPKPADLAAVTGADRILFAEFDGFAGKIKQAAKGTDKLVPVQVENTPTKIRAEVSRLGQLFGTGPAATAWLADFDTEYAKLSGQVKAKAGGSKPVVAHQFMTNWADFAGLRVVGTYGPQPVKPDQLADLSAKKPVLVLANGQAPATTPDIPGAERVDLVNYPGADLDLLGVFRTNAERLTTALTTG
jgi:zinc transport system substrate-binding protein